MYQLFACWELFQSVDVYKVFFDFFFVNTNKSVEEMDTDQARKFVRADLATKSLQMLSADNQRCTLRRTHHEVPLSFSVLLARILVMFALHLFGCLLIE